MENLLMYLGSGLFLGSLLLSIPVGIIFAVKKEYDGFRYGAFFLVSCQLCFVVYLLLFFSALIGQEDGKISH